MSITANNYSNTAIYEYDKVGNITKAGDVTYKYDSLGQLVRVNDPKYGTTVYVYDVGGNIKYVKSYDYTIGELGAVKDTKEYSYGNTTWKDLLTSYNGETITYDEIGNPIYYYTNDKFNWSMGRQLSSISFTNGTSAYYNYNSDGLRTQKRNYSEEEYAYFSQTDYTWVDGKITSMLLTDFGDEKCTHAKIYIRYDESDKPIALEYNGEEYYYVTNLQGDIIAILDSNGNCVVEYTYDAWGKVLSVTGTLATTLGYHNPLRYRGYCYDNETGFYYLQSRYYDPTVGRFINADEVGYLGVNGTIPSYNLFAYCENNPVNNSDPNGMLSIASIICFVKTIGFKAWKLITNIWKAFVKPDKIHLKPFEVVIDMVVGVLVPSFHAALKLLTYKAINKKLLQIAFKRASKKFINVLAKFGINLGLNVLTAATLNNLIFKYTSRFLTVGGIICLVIDRIDGKIDYWFNFGKFAK